MNGLSPPEARARPSPRPLRERCARRALASLAVALCGCAADERPLDGVLRLSHVQARGTHNSYHLEPLEPFDDSHRYSHAPLDVQVAELGVRQLELDLHLTARGHFEVFHLPGGVDMETTCRRFTDCLALVKRWSDANPEHVPLLVWLEPKDEDLDWADATLQPIFGHYQDLEEELLSVWPLERILTPGEVRGAHATLPEALQAEGWPALGRVRGRIWFGLLDGENHRAAYREAHPALEDRLLFVTASSSSDPDAALFKINDAQANAAEVQALVEAGFIVTSTADGAADGEATNRARLQASLDAGAHFLSSDFPAPSAGYWAEVPGGAPVRCNPRSAPAECTPAALE